MNLKRIIREEFDDLLWINEIDVKLKGLIESGLINKIIEKNTTLTLSGTVDDLSRRGEEKFKSDVVFDVKLLGTDGTVEGTNFRLVDCDDEYYPLIIFGYPEECEGVFLKSDGDLVVDNYNDIIKELGVINESEDDDWEWARTTQPVELEKPEDWVGRSFGYGQPIIDQMDDEEIERGDSEEIFTILGVDEHDNLTLLKHHPLYGDSYDSATTPRTLRNYISKGDWVWK